MSPTPIPYPWTVDTQHVPPYNMDPLHIEKLYQICSIVKPKSVIEIGSFKGASTSAFIEALNAGHIESLAIFELHSTPELQKTIEQAKDQTSVTCNWHPYYDTPMYADLVLIDGDHGWPALADLAAALSMGVPTIVLHDSNTVNMGLKDCWGSQLACQILKASSLYECWEDKEKRPGMHTERGMFVGWKWVNFDLLGWTLKEGGK